MITVEQLLKMPVGEKVGGFELTVKTDKKKWQVGQNWIHQVTLTDTTGDILADVNLGPKYAPLQRSSSIRVIIGIIQAAEISNEKIKRTGIKLFVDQYTVPITIGEPPETMNFSNGEPIKVVRGKIKCWLTAAKVQQNGATIEEVDGFVHHPLLKEIIDSIMEG